MLKFVSAQPVARLTTFLRALVEVYQERDIPFLAGSVAYAAFVSLLPLILLLLIAASLLGGEALRQYVLRATEQYLTPVASDIIGQSLSGATNSLGFSIFGGVALLWSVLKVFRTLDTAFSDIYQAKADGGILDRLKDGVIVLGAVATAVLTMLAVSAIFAFATPASLEGSSRLLIRGLSYLALITGLTVAFIPMYYIFPDIDVEIREALPGAVVAAIGWTLLQGLFQLYVSMSSAGELYGIIGGVILVITWLYFGSIVLLIGAATNFVLFERTSLRQSSTVNPETTH